MRFLTDAIKKLINDPAYDDYYLYSYVNKRGEIKYSCVLPHADSMIYRQGLDIKLACKEIQSYYLLGCGGEDEITELKYDCEANNN
ncbi:hypothetical protein V1951_17625 [Yersinia sp. 2544 StPb PI]|uniref:hypothetical protein n=1 Tax=Yersinia sp. 2544 StPb PI TaxID=3117409 RepID=UPI003B27E8F4